MLFRSLQDYENAIKDFSSAIGINPYYSKAWSNRGLTKEKLNDLQGAIRDYSKAIAIDDTDVETYFNRGNAKFRLKDISGAIEDYSNAIRLDAGYKAAYLNRGNAWASSGIKINACSDWEMAGAYRNINKFCK